MPLSPCLVPLFDVLDLPPPVVEDVGDGAERRRGYALAELAVRVAAGYARGTLYEADGARLAVLEEVVDERTATAANSALRACSSYAHHPALVFAACATAQATGLSLGSSVVEVGFYAARVVQSAGPEGLKLGRELAEALARRFLSA